MQGSRNDLLECLKQLNNCKSERCDEVIWECHREYLLINVDECPAFERNIKRADCIVFCAHGDKIYACVIEVKHSDIRKASEQIRETFSFLERFLRCSAKLIPIPVVYAREGVSHIDVRRARREKIRYRGEPISLRIVRDGKGLKDLCFGSLK